MKKPSKPISIARRRFLKTAAVSVAAGLGTTIYGHEAEAEHLEVVHQTVRIAGWPMSAAGMKIGQLSDLHCEDARAVARTARAARLLLAQKPDVVALTGDYITGSGSRHAAPGGPDWAARCAEALAPLTGVPGGVFAILGNHDWWSRQADHVAARLEQVGFQMLRNRAVPLPGANGVWLVGLDSLSHHAQNPAQALQGVPKTAVKILLMHEPDYADQAPPGFALQLSGHSHAGQIRLPGLPPLHCPEYGRRYPEGLQQTTRHLVYTSRGVGMMGPQMRLFCPPEVTVLTIQPA